MRVLFANIPTPGNRFLIDLKQALEKHCEVIWDCDEFWKCKRSFDIVHIHWPEYLSFELESYLHTKIPIPDNLWNRINNCYEYWSKKSKIVYTRHVQNPHARWDDDFKKLYRLNAGYCNLVVHFAQFSILQFKNFYPEYSHIQHKVIPHHNYASLPNMSSKNEARNKLHIGQETKVMLVFGAVKENEKVLIKKAFNYIPGKNKVLLAPGWNIARRKIGYIRLREWIYKLECYLASSSKKKRINVGFISEDEAHFYLNAADFMLIPRTNELNSGNIALGFTFGLVVVGKNSSDIGEILVDTGNPVFDFNDNISLKNAIKNAIYSSNNNLGPNNKKIAINEWGVDKIALLYNELYNS